MKKYIIGSRGSDLALWQANYTLDRLKELNIEAEIKVISTQGDRIQNLSFDKLEGKGFFTKEIEEALLKKKIDIAVHSHKDLPTVSPEHLIIAAVSDREDPSEILLVHKDAVDPTQKFSIKKNAIVGTSSARRKSQLITFRSDITLKELRGNVPTRIRKLKEKNYDAIMLAFAGVERLQLDISEFHVEELDCKEFIPAPAQGVLAIQIRESDTELFNLLQPLNNKEVQQTIGIERKVLNMFDGGCQLPLGVYCEKSEDEEEEGELYKTWIAKAEVWNSYPKYFYFESKKEEGFAEKIVNKINNAKPASVFITRDIKKYDIFSKVLEGNGYKVSGKALIDIQPVAIKKLPKTDWVFFSSKHAVKNFFGQNPEISVVKYAAVGKATSAELRKHGKVADFIGYSTDTKLTGKQFASMVKSGIVLFPQAKGSMRTIQQQFTNPEQVIDLIVYETIKRNEDNIPKAEILVFTSPSNVEAFFEKHTVETAQKIVAMGEATANALRRAGVKHCSMPASFDDIGLLQAVFGV